ncbi:IclR family transcriptional regulator C-terminal domain-containing protein [Streptomyces sp. NPDC006997]|uniref:IclR family transcriptional regulator domain-containing protein n=1 Tax=Streptomyces sp. NPDC006997 TaxID=3155356 RepID=UPI0033CFDB61
MSLAVGDRDGIRFMSVNITIGTRLPAYATSMGRVLLSDTPDQTPWETGPLPPLTPHTITDVTALKQTRAQTPGPGVRPRRPGT